MLTSKLLIITLKILVGMSNYFLQKLKIDNLEFPRFMSAPIDGVTDTCLRQLIRDFSPEELLFTEMRHVALIANKKDLKDLFFDPKEYPLAFQISANSTDFIEKAIEKILATKISVLNLNAGCPAKNIVKSGSGSALMGNPENLKNILNTIQKNINNINPKIPLTLKIRAGFKVKNALDISLLAQDLGVKAIIIHPRTQPEGFTSYLDYNLVKDIKNKLNIPVIFSGNLNSFAKVKQTYELTGVDGFMIGRALYGTPWKIKEILEESQGKIFQVSNNLMISYAIKHLQLASQFYGQRVGFHIFKKQVPLYIKNVENASVHRKNILRTQSEEDMLSQLNNLLIKNS